MTTKQDLHLLSGQVETRLRLLQWMIGVMFVLMAGLFWKQDQVEARMVESLTEVSNRLAALEARLDVDGRGD